MGEVYLAEDTRLERQVALKVLPADLTAEPEARQRFEREARAAAALNHPNIVTIHEIGEHQGRVFMAMEYVKGRTLKEIIAATTEHGRPLPLGDVVRIASQIAAGLSAAHAKGIVHRDIKPQNIIIGADAAVKILDFGLAKLGQVSTLTKGSSIMGTVHYISPEQALGREADARSDLWSLGVVLYEMLTGRLPFGGESPPSILYAIVKTPPAPLAEQRPSLPAAMLACMKRLLAKDPGKRYQNTGEFVADLQRIEIEPDGEVTEILRSPGRERRHLLGAAGGSPLLRRRLPASLLAAAALAALLLVIPGSRDLARRALGISGIPRERHLAVLPFAAAGGAESGPLAEGFSAAIAEKLTQLEQFHDRLWTVPAAEILADRDKPALVLQRLWGCNLFLSGELYAENNSLRLLLKLTDARKGRELNRVELQGHLANLSIFQEGLLPALGRLLKLKADPAAEKTINAGGTALPGAFVLYLKGKGLAQESAGAAQLGRGIAFLERALQQDSGYVQARLALANARRFQYKMGRDPAILQMAMEQGETARQEARSSATAQWTWALLLKENGEKATAMEALQETLRLNERCYAACIELAKADAAAGKTNEAERLFKRAIDLRPGYPRALAYLAYFYMSSGRSDEAIAYYQKQAELAPGDIRAFNNLGILYQQKGDRASAKAMYEKSNSVEPNVTAQSNLATLFFYEGDFQRALPLFREAASRGNDCRWWGNLADTYRQIPEFRDKAAAAYRQAIAMAEAALERSPDNHELLSALAMYYSHSNEKGRASEAIARALALAPADPETSRRAILVYEAIGMRARALEALRGYRERLGAIREIEKEPDLAALRLDPAYADIIQSGK